MYQLAVEDHAVDQARQVGLVGELRVHPVDFREQRSHAFAAALRLRLSRGLCMKGRDGGGAKDDNKAVQGKTGWAVHAGPLR
ncbi:hypothetical protein GCM10027317_02840 [Massilia agri]